jgi:hypothetical protein
MNIRNKRLISALLLAPLVLSLLLLPIKPEKASAAPTVTITSPTEGQSISGTNFTAAGTATPNTTVVLSSGGVGFAQTISDGSGNWSVATSLPAGNISLTAKAIQNPEYGYFATISTDFSIFNVNRLRISDNTVNPGGGWPIDSNGTNPFIMIPSPVNNTYYTGNFLVPSVLPAKFDASLAVAPTAVTGSYPADPQVNKGAFTQDGSLYFAPNMNAGNISVINTATNAWQQDITVGSSGDAAITIWAAPSGLLYAPTLSGKILVISPSTLSIVNEINVGCPVGSLVFSQDANYPFFYGPCLDSAQVKKIRLSDLSVVETWNTGINTSSGAITLDNKKLYLIGTYAGDGSSDSDKIKVLSTENGSTLSTIQLSGGGLGFLPTSDFQKIYASIPGDPIGTQIIDVIDPITDTIEASIPTDGFPGPLGTNPTQDAEATIQVSFVLGATTSTATQKLAETGAIGISSILLIGIIIAITSYLYIDYRAHKKPLRAEDPNVKYTFLHHIRVVSMPRLKYRVAVSKRSTYK